MTNFQEIWLTNRRHGLVHVTNGVESTLCGIKIIKDGRWFVNKTVVNPTCKRCIKLMNKER
jgi:hypothetical protein